MATEKTMEKELDTIDVDGKTIDAMTEIAYTLNELGFIDYKIDDDTAETLYKLVKLAEKYRGKVPERLRM